MSKSQKEITAMSKLQERIGLLLPAWTLTRSDDAYGAMLLMSDTVPASAGDQVFAVRIKKVPTDFVNSIGLSQEIYAPLCMQVIEEASTIAGVSQSTLANRMVIDNELSRLGIKQERYLNTDTTAVTLAQFASSGLVTGSNAIGSVQADLEWPLAGQ